MRPRSGSPEEEEHQHDGQATGEDDRVEAEGREILAQHDLQGVQWQGHQQLEGVLGAFLGPGSHGNSWDKGDQQEGQRGEVRPHIDDPVEKKGVHKGGARQHQEDRRVRIGNWASRNKPLARGRRQCAYRAGTRQQTDVARQTWAGVVVRTRWAKTASRPAPGDAGVCGQLFDAAIAKQAPLGG